MTTFDFQQVRQFADEMKAKLEACHNGEGLQCHNVDATLTQYANVCCRFANQLRQWAQDVFAGRVAYDADAERLWRAELADLYSRASGLVALGRQAESECFVIEGQTRLASALFQLQRLMTNWITPTVSVGPAARLGRATGAAERDIAARLTALPPLPADWQPNDPRQAAVFRQVRQR